MSAPGVGNTSYMGSCSLGDQKLDRLETVHITLVCMSVGVPTNKHERRADSEKKKRPGSPVFRD